MVQFNTRERLSGFSSNSNKNALNAIIVLARAYAAAKEFPGRYAKYGYDFPKMIRTKVTSLEDLNQGVPWVIDFSCLLLESMDSPQKIMNICMQYLEDMRSGRMCSGYEKEHTDG